MLSNHSDETTPLVTLEQIKQAQERLRTVAVRTPLIDWHVPRTPSGGKHKLYLKPENLQPVGSFKLRGAFNKIASLSLEDRKRGVIAYSSGNHAQGVAYAARALGVKAVIVMPQGAPAIKRESTAAMGAEIVLVGPGSSERKARAEELAAQYGYVIVPPYNDPTVIAGQGTIGLEILEDLPQVDTVLAPIGGGGLVSGIATAIKLQRAEILQESSVPAPLISAKNSAGKKSSKKTQPTHGPVRIIGVEPEFAADAQASLRAGHIVALPAEQTARTIADGLRTQSVGEIPFEHIRRYVDDIVTVTENEIRAAMRFLGSDSKLVAEPSGAVSVAAFLFHGKELPGTVITVAVLSGGNVEPRLLAEIMSQPAGFS